MTAYILRRLLYAVPLIFAVNLLTFVLFIYVNTPDDVARKAVGERRATPERIRDWKRLHWYDLPPMWNARAEGVRKITETMFFQKTLGLLRFDFGISDQEEKQIGSEILRRIPPSLGITVPTLLIGVTIDIAIAALVAWLLGTYVDFTATVLCVMGLSISFLFYIIGGQWVFGQMLHVSPISGYGAGAFGLKFLVLPVVVGVVHGVGSGVRLYRTFLLEELGKDYIRTARSKGLPESAVLYKHCLKNALIPIVTGVVVMIPFLFMGSLLEENFFAIPGLGSYLIESIHSQDYTIVRAMVFLGSLLTIAGYLLVDITYSLVDPRVRLS